MKKYFGNLERMFETDESGTRSVGDVVQRRFFLLWAVLMSTGAVVWLSICFVYELWLPAAAPAVYLVMTAINLWILGVTRSFFRARFIQLFLSLLLPFLFQWSLGGFVQSGAAVLWAITAMFVSLTFQGTRKALGWVVVFVLLVIVSGAADNAVQNGGIPMPDRFVNWLFVVNIVGMTVVVFGLLWIFVRQRQRALEKLTAINIELVESQTRLVRAEKMASIGSLTAGIAHEMNNPVGVIKCSAEVTGKCVTGIRETIENAGSIAEIRSDRKFQRTLTALEDSSRSVVDSSGRLKEVADRFKSFARLDQKVTQQTDLRDDLDNTIAIMSPNLPLGIEIVKQYGAVPRVTCQPGEINQVFMNLLQNAVDAIDGDGRITVTTGFENNLVVVSIGDNGPGIPEDQLRRLFDPGFFRTNGRVKAGMGLMLSRQIVDGHGGDIKIDSKPGVGTTVRIMLPVENPAAATSCEG